MFDESGLQGWHGDRGGCVGCGVVTNRPFRKLMEAKDWVRAIMPWGLHLQKPPGADPHAVVMWEPGANHFQLPDSPITCP